MNNTTPTAKDPLDILIRISGDCLSSFVFVVDVQLSLLLAGTAEHQKLADEDGPWMPVQTFIRETIDLSETLRPMLATSLRYQHIQYFQRNPDRVPLTGEADAGAILIEAWLDYPPDRFLRTFVNAVLPALVGLLARIHTLLDQAEYVKEDILMTGDEFQQALGLPPREDGSAALINRGRVDKHLLSLRKEVLSAIETISHALGEE